MNEDGKLCELCLLEEDTIKHKIDECQKLERTELRIEEVMKDQSDQKVEKWLREVEKQGKSTEKKEVKYSNIIYLNSRYNN